MAQEAFCHVMCCFQGFVPSQMASTSLFLSAGLCPSLPPAMAGSCTHAKATVLGDGRQQVGSRVGCTLSILEGFCELP